MSRLYDIVEKLSKAPSLFSSGLTLFEWHQRLLSSQSGITDWAEILIQCEMFWPQKTLASNLSTHRTYPISIQVAGSYHEKTIQFKLELIYSSTCPQSAALSLDVLMKDFQAQFARGSETVSVREIELWLAQGLPATPHAQRSQATIEITWSQSEWEQWIKKNDTIYNQIGRLITELESTLGAISQNLVKREDEQVFAVLSARNTMFCEDAARRLHTTLTKLGFKRFKGEVCHFESLHPFDVKARFSS